MGWDLPPILPVIHISSDAGTVAASHVRTKDFFKDFWTLLASLFGGESRYYTHLANECTEAAADAMVE